MKYIVNNYQAGLLFKNESFVRFVPEGSYRFWKFSKKSIRIVDKRKKLEDYNLDATLLSGDQKLTEQLVSLNLKDHEIALHYVNGNLLSILGRGRYTYFKEPYKHEFVVVDTTNPFVSEKIDPSVFNTAAFAKSGQQFINIFAVSAGKIGILLRNGEYVKTLQSGTHYFWKGPDTIEVKTVDIRKRVMEVNGQELLSQDKVTLRMNFILLYKINDAVKAATGFENFEEQLYMTMQLALREYVSTKNLDELLAQKHEIGNIVLNAVKDKETDFGSSFIEAGVKDIILPGEIKDILNTVLVAEKKALANVITRREETASTRSLLNTAKLMEENKTLYRLKELEYLEKICDKVGSISLNSGAGILEQLSVLAGK